MSDRTYELIYVLKPDAAENEIADMHKQVADIVERMGGTIKTDTGPGWGRRKLAYEIGHHKEGFYVLEVITGGGELMKEIEKGLHEIIIGKPRLRLDEDQEKEGAFNMRLTGESTEQIVDLSRDFVRRLRDVEGFDTVRTMAKAGEHVLFVQGRDAVGKSGVPAALFFEPDRLPVVEATGSGLRWLTLLAAAFVLVLRPGRQRQRSSAPEARPAAPETPA